MGGLKKNSIFAQQLYMDDEMAVYFMYLSKNQFNFVCKKCNKSTIIAKKCNNSNKSAITAIKIQ